jgi:hypothetical protein
VISPLYTCHLVKGMRGHEKKVAASIVACFTNILTYLTLILTAWEFKKPFL